MAKLRFWLGVKRLLWWWSWRERRERVVTGVVWMLPREIVYWAFVRLAVHGYPDGDPSNQTVGDVMKRTQDWAHG